MLRSRRSVVTRTARRRPDNDAADGGFTLIEVLVATAIFAILSTAFASTLSATLSSFRASKARTVAEGVAASQIEGARRMAYADLGTVGGNPPGLLAPTGTVTNGGQVLSVATHVSYVNDPLPAALGAETGANYKSVTVTVTLAGSAISLAKVQTLVAPPNEPSRSKGLVKVQVVDYAANTGVSGAVVSLGTGPDAPVSDTTDAGGRASFAALTPATASGPTNKYTVTASAPGYQTLREDLPPAPAASVALAAGQVFPTVVHVFQPITLNVHLLGPTGLPFTGAATLTVSSSRGAGTVATTGADTAVTQINGESLIPSVSYTVGASAAGGYFSAGVTLTAGATNYPTVLTSAVTLTLQTYATTGQIQVKLKNSSGAAIVGSSVVLTGGPGSIAAWGVTAASTGIATIVVPSGTTPNYAVLVPAQFPYSQVTSTMAGPSGTATVLLTLTVT